MRHLVVVGVVLGSSIASASPKEVQKLARTSIEKLSTLENDSALGFDEASIVLDERGRRIEIKEQTGCSDGAVANAFYGCVQASFEHKVTTLVGDASGSIGWFQGTFTVTMTPEEGDANDVKKSTWRFGGIATKTGTWDIAAAMYTRTLPDAELFKRNDQMIPKGAPKLSGDQKLAGIVAGWFVSGFAPNAAKKGTLIASGTAPGEFKSGAAAAKLAGAWDKLKLIVRTVDAKLLEDGKVAWITADVLLPRKDGKGAIAMKLAAVLVPDGLRGWQWVSLQYQAEPSLLGN